MNDESLSSTLSARHATGNHWEAERSLADDASFNEAAGKLKARFAAILKNDGGTLQAGHPPGIRDNGHGQAAPSNADDEDIQIIDEDELDQIGDLGNELDDPEGWMRENPCYWDELPDPVPPTRQGWLSHRIQLLSDQLDFIRNGKHPGWPKDRVPDHEWQHLYAEFEKSGRPSSGQDSLSCGDSGRRDQTRVQPGLPEIAEGSSTEFGAEPSPEAIAEGKRRSAPTKENIERLLDDMDECCLERLSTPLHTAAMCIKSLQIMRSLPRTQGPNRVAEEYWRLLAAKAIEVLFKPLRSELDNQVRARAMTEMESKSFNAFMDSFGGIEVFLEASKVDPTLVDAEPNYFARGVNESFGKTNWTGPHAWAKSFAAQCSRSSNATKT